MTEALPAIGMLCASAAYLFGYWLGFRKGRATQKSEAGEAIKAILAQKKNEYEVLRQAVKQGDTVMIFGCPYVPGYPVDEEPPARERMN